MSSNPYDRLQVRTIVNAAGTATRLSGPPMTDEVADAVREAARHTVDMTELQARASKLIADATGAEAGLVTSGAAAGLMLGTAACLAGLDAARMNRLPDTTDMRREFVVARSQRNMYDHAVRAAGATLVEVGIPDRVSGAGVRDAEPWEYRAAIGERTAGILYVANAQARPALEAVVAVARAANVPVLVDAAAQLPPVENLRRFTALGADLVVFSGGKAIGGPQASGILCGRRALIASAALQCLDLDIPFEHWEPPRDFIDKAAIEGFPRHGIGRACKVGKEQIVGLLVALERFVANGGARIEAWAAIAHHLAQALASLPHTRVAIEEAPGTAIPLVILHVDEAGAGCGASDLARKLRQGEPNIHCGLGRLGDGALVFAPTALREGDVDAIAAALFKIFGMQSKRGRARGVGS